MNKRLQFFETEPIIAAVKTEEQLERALTSGSNIIFFLFGNIQSHRGHRYRKQAKTME